MNMLLEFSAAPTAYRAGHKKYPESGVSYNANHMSMVLEGECIVVMKTGRKRHDEAMKDTERAVTRVMIDDRNGKESRIEKKLHRWSRNGR